MQIAITEERADWSLSSDMDFIYNRFDILFPSESVLLVICLDNKTYSIPVHFEEKTAQFGLWLASTPAKAVCDVAKYVFHNHPALESISFEHYLQDISAVWKAQVAVSRNHWNIMLPETEEELDRRLSTKKRYNIKREKRLAREQIGEYEVVSFSASEVPSEIIDRYFAFKQAGYGIDYSMTPAEYLKKYHVSHVYILRFVLTGEIGAIVCSCEQSDNVYLENLTYNPELKKYSLGSILYDEYLRLLIQTGKRSLYLGYGQQVYKSLYGAEEHITYSGKLYRSGFIYLKREWLPNQKKNLIRKTKKLIKKLDVFNLRSVLR